MMQNKTAITNMYLNMPKEIKLNVVVEVNNLPQLARFLGAGYKSREEVLEDIRTSYNQYPDPI